MRLAREFVAEHGTHRARRLPFDLVIGAWLLVALPALLAGGHYVAGAVAVACAAILLGAGLPAATSTAGGMLRVWYPFFLVPALYTTLPTLSSAMHGERYFDAGVQRWEAAIFGGQPATTLGSDAAWLPLSELMHAAYLSYYLLIFLPPLLIYLRGDMRGFTISATAFVLASLLCFAVFVYFPVQGPRYLFDAPTGNGIENGPLYRLTHTILEAGSSRGAAFPSGHVAVAVAQSVVAWRWLRGHAWWISTVTVLLAVSTVYGGFHYAVDVGVGAVVGGVGAWTAEAWGRRKLGDGGSLRTAEA